MKNLLFYLPFLTMAIPLHAQQEDAWVYFTPKENVATALATPETILTQRALERKQRHNVAIDERDVPLDQARITSIKNADGVTVLAKSKWFNCVYVRGSETAIRSLVALPEVASVDFADNNLDGLPKGERRDVKNQKSVPRKKINKFNKLPVYDYGNSRAQIEQLNAAVLHEKNYTGDGMIIAVVDAGFPAVDRMTAFEEARSEGRILGGYDFVADTDDIYRGSDHGTHTFSDIGAKIPGVFVGTAPDASYYLFRTEDGSRESPLEEAYWVAAAERADSLGVDVINTSLGYTQFDNSAYDYDQSDMDGITAFISKGANVAFEKGMLPVTSAGNSGSTSWGIVSAPGDAIGSLTVGAITASGDYVGFSSRGPSADGRVKPDIVARGRGASIVDTDNSIGSADGTSFSSPIMAGAVACLWQAFPKKTNAEIMQMVRSSSSQFNNPDIRLGYGIPDFGSLLDNLSSTTPEAQGVYTLFPNPVIKDITVQLSDAGGYNEIQLFSTEGKMMLQKEINGAITLDLERFAPGVYFVVLQSKSNRYTQKIIKQ